MEYGLLYILGIRSWVTVLGIRSKMTKNDNKWDQYEDLSAIGTCLKTMKNRSGIKLFFNLWDWLNCMSISELPWLVF